MDGRPLLFPKQLVILDHLIEPISRKKLQLLKTPIWVMAGPCPPECDRKDIMHAIGSSFGGLLQAETNGESCKIRVMVEVHKLLRRGVVVLDEDQNKSWVPFKYERLTGFYFGCGCMGHLVKDCSEISQQIKELPDDDMPYSLALKAEFNFPASLVCVLVKKIFNLSSQMFYMGEAQSLDEHGVTLGNKKLSPISA